VQAEACIDVNRISEFSPILREHFVRITKKLQLTLLRELVAVYCTKHEQNIDTIQSTFSVNI